MNQKTTPILVVLLIVAAFLIGMYYTKIQYLEGGKGTVAGTTANGTGPSSQPATPAPVSSDQIKTAFSKSVVKFGNADSKLTFLEISDPSCPYCQIAGGQNGELNKQVDQQRGSKTFTLVADGGTYIAPVPEMEKLVKAGKASYAYLYFPGHGNGQMGAQAMYCAFEKGKFWEVQNKLMTSEGYDLLNNTVKNDKTKSGDLASFLSSEVDETFMKSCLDSGKYSTELQTEQGIAQQLMTSGAGGSGNIGTPTFFINDQFFGGAYSYKDMEPTVTAALK